MKLNQIFRRVLSLVLCLCMLLSMGVTAFAADASGADATNSAFESNKKLTDGGDNDPETYTIDIDAIVNGEASEVVVGTPLDVAIIFDRSDSMSLPASAADTRTISSATDLTNYLKTLDKTKPLGYYRATNLSRTGRKFYSDTSYYGKGYLSWEPMRYNTESKQWEVFETTLASKYSDEWGNLEGAHGIILQSEYVLNGYYGYWRSMSEAYTNFNSRNDSNGNVPASCKYQIAVSRLTKAQEAVAAFINDLNDKADSLPNGQNHTVSITCFGGSVFKNGYNYDGFVFQDARAGEEYQAHCSFRTIQLAGSDATSLETTELDYMLNYILTSPYVYGTTHTEKVMQEMNDKNFLPAQQDGRKRVVILLTDGCPTGSMAFDASIANSAIATAKTLKDDGVNIFSLSYMNGVTPGNGYVAANSNGTDNQKAQNFLHLVSSNYPDATSMTKPGTQAGNDSFMSDDGTGKDLIKHFNSILEKITTKFETPLPGEKDSISIYDEITREFMIDADREVKVYIQKYNGSGSFGAKEYIGSHKLTADADDAFNVPEKGYRLDWDCKIAVQSSEPGVNLDISSIRLNWLDAKYGALREKDVTNAGSAYPTYTKGYKIGLELPIEVNRDNTLGGNNILTNTSESGLFRSTTDETAKKPSGEKLITYDSPNANVEVKVDTEVFDYFMDLEYLVNNQSTDLNSDFAQEIFAAMLEDPDALLEYLKNNRNDYVDLGIDLQDLYALIANAKDNSFSTSGAQSGTSFDFSVDQALSAILSVIYKSSQTDSIGVPPFGNYTVPYTPNYYGPKYVVVDFDETVKTPLDKEGGLNPAVTTTNGKLEGSSICYNFRKNYNSGAKSYLEKNYTTVGYQVTAINAPKSQNGNTTVARNFYVIPANVMTYDDTFLSMTKGVWDTVGTYAEGEQSHDNAVTHGFDKLYNDTYSKDYYHDALQAVTVSKAKDMGVAQASFTIYGTGFDIFAQTSKDAGAMAVEVCTDSAFEEDYKTFIVDTYLKDATLNQIPVVRVDGLECRTWYIRITAFYDSIFDHNYVSQWRNGGLTEEKLRDRYDIPADADFTFIPSESGYDHPATRVAAAANGQYNIYIDGIRVYNTLGTQLSAVAQYAYNDAKESVAYITNINDGLVDATDANSWTEGDMTGVLYNAASSDKVDDSTIQGDITEGIILGMEGKLHFDPKVEMPKDPDNAAVTTTKHYVYTDKDCKNHVTYNGQNVYARLREVLRGKDKIRSWVLDYYHDGDASKPMLGTEIVEAFGGAMPVYYNAKYSQWGPEKEVYLAKDQGVAFALSDTSARVMVSFKSHDGNSATLSVYDASTKAFKVLATTTSRVEMYYDITKCADANGYIYLMATEGIVSICNIKTTGTAAATVYVNSALAGEAARVFKNASLPVDGTADIKHSLDLASDISLNYAVATSKLADYDYSYMEVSFNGATYLIEPEIRGEYGYFTVDGITAVGMTEELTAKLHLFLGEEEFVSETDVYSVAAYAYAQLNKASASEELKAVCANLLRYGAQAQTYKGSDNVLADADLTAEHKAYLTDLNTVSVVSAAKALGDVENGVAWAGKSLVLDSKVAVKAIFDLKNYAGNMEALNLRVSYVNGKGEEVSLVIEEAELYNAAYGYYAFTVDTLLATDMRSELTMALYEGEIQVSQTQIYSVESYCANRTGVLAELGKTLLAYGDAAKAYFVK